MTQEAPLSLAQSFAGMAAAMVSMARIRARRGEVAHALILAMLAAMLGCLTILAAEWEAGRLAPAAPKRRRSTARARTIPRQAQSTPTPGLRPQAAPIPGPQDVMAHPAAIPRPWRPPRIPHPAHVPRPALHPLTFFKTRPGYALQHALIVTMS